MNTVGNNIKITFFGESHGPFIGIVIDNLPAGLKIDEDLLRNNLQKRRPAKKINTNRIETDEYQFVSGYYNGFTTGAALTVLIPNKNTISKDYKTFNNIPRPSHADYPAYVKYKGFNDTRGGGFFSGRLTTLWIIIGSISEQILKKYNIYIGSHIYSLKNIKDDSFDFISNDVKQLKELNAQSFPLLNHDKKEAMFSLIKSVKEAKNSIGGIVESKIVNIPVGLGEPYFLSIESYISNLLFSVPGVKGVEFGKGFDITANYGSEMNDSYHIENNKIKTTSNNNGGILGGLSTGMPIIIKTAFKPTSSIGIKQNSVDLKNNKNTTIEISGRHDPQYVSRTPIVVNSILSFVILDFLMFKLKENVLS
ncbi:chorismate synthase [Candidatus Izemoplasma sp. B36]|uniref:chorismate synthase n=1 Tax=Candidatus Izemoplasma sp. B36 TaxID=3242468 RepID=UPI003557A95F